MDVTTGQDDNDENRPAATVHPADGNFPAVGVLGVRPAIAGRSAAGVHGSTDNHPALEVRQATPVFPAAKIRRAIDINTGDGHRDATKIDDNHADGDFPAAGVLPAVAGRSEKCSENRPVTAAHAPEGDFPAAGAADANADEGAALDFPVSGDQPANGDFPVPGVLGVRPAAVGSAENRPVTAAHPPDEDFPAAGVRPGEGAAGDFPVSRDQPAEKLTPSRDQPTKSGKSYCSIS